MKKITKTLLAISAISLTAASTLALTACNGENTSSTNESSAVETNENENTESVASTETTDVLDEVIATEEEIAPVLASLENFGEDIDKAKEVANLDFNVPFLTNYQVYAKDNFVAVEYGDNTDGTGNTYYLTFSNIDLDAPFSDFSPIYAALHDKISTYNKEQLETSTETEQQYICLNENNNSISGYSNYTDENGITHAYDVIVTKGTITKEAMRRLVQELSDLNVPRG